MQGGHVFHHTREEPHLECQHPRSSRILPANVCCGQLVRCPWSPGPVRPQECCVLGSCSGSWASLGQAENCPLSAFRAFSSNSSKKPSQRYRQQQCYNTPMSQSLEFSGLMRLSWMFAAVLMLSPKAPASWKSLALVIFLYNSSKSIPHSLPWDQITLHAVAGPLLILPSHLCLILVCSHS